MFPIPRHLIKIYKVNSNSSDEHNLEGHIHCDCGCQQFEILIFADMDNDNPQVCEYEDDYAFVIKSICKDCKKEWLLFDMFRHGYNGYVCHDGVTVPDSKLKEYVCPECKNRFFEIAVGIELEDKEQFIEEIVEEDPDNFSEEDYVDAFNWINIDIKCCCCDRQSKNWISFETS